MKLLLGQWLVEMDEGVHKRLLQTAGEESPNITANHVEIGQHLSIKWLNTRYVAAQRTPVL